MRFRHVQSKKSNLNCATPVEACLYKNKIGNICCHYCGVDITDPEIMVKYGQQCQRYSVVKPSCDECPEFILRRQKKIIRPQVARVAKRAREKSNIRKQVRKRRRILPLPSDARIPKLSSRDPCSENFITWLAVNVEWWKKLRTVFFKGF